MVCCWSKFLAWRRSCFNEPMIILVTSTIYICNNLTVFCPHESDLILLETFLVRLVFEVTLRSHSLRRCLLRWACFYAVLQLLDGLVIIQTFSLKCDFEVLSKLIDLLCHNEQGSLVFTASTSKIWNRKEFRQKNRIFLAPNPWYHHSVGCRFTCPFWKSSATSFLGMSLFNYHLACHSIL